MFARRVFNRLSSMVCVFRSCLLPWCCLLFVFFGGRQIAAAKDAICLVQNDTARAAIILPDKAISPEQLAAEELQYHIQKGECEGVF